MTLPYNNTRPDRTNVAGYVVGAACAFAALLMLFWWAVNTAAGQSADHSMMVDLQAYNSPTVIHSIERLVGRPVPIAVASLAVVVAIGMTGAQRGARLLGALGAMVTVPVVAELVKAHVDRPVLNDIATHNSFPSGTTAAYAALATGLTCVAWRPWQQVLAACAWGVAAFVGVLVVIMGWHRPSDAVAALLLGAGVTCLTLAGVRAAGRSARPQRERSAPVRRQFEVAARD
ncbi:hypothetical protein VV02_05195 [Luteipulveratus mongoliensis]|uniref:Phosphatidic acid phosphatase type 2/haloperoxidase domain-containing protein n=2 Tax=Luteipulveratus mongoliensis TaxID=571913 RepID=A0A0K1JFB7_9MICO|nr:hypothetical protein VV02_05195 [Luteipulveratus mongoliensis]